MLFALRHPAVLLGLLIGFAVGIPLRAALQRRTALHRTGARRRRGLRPIGAATTPRQPWTSYLDPYGTVAAVVAGVGWGARPPLPAPRLGRSRMRPALLLPLLAAAAVHGVLAAAGFAAYRAAGGPQQVLGHGVLASDILHGQLALGSTVAQAAVGFAVENLGCALLALVPIPPLELGVLLWSQLPRTPGARRVAYHLLEEAWGVAVVLVGLLLPLAGQRPALLVLLDALADPLLRLT